MKTPAASLSIALVILAACTSPPPDDARDPIPAAEPVRAAGFDLAEIEPKEEPAGAPLPPEPAEPEERPSAPAPGPRSMIQSVAARN